MQEGLHPKYRKVVFRDASCDFVFMTGSTQDSKETIKWEDGNTYPLITIDISSASHPFFTGKMKLLDTAGRVERFNNKYKTAAKK